MFGIHSVFTRRKQHFIVQSKWNVQIVCSALHTHCTYTIQHATKLDSWMRRTKNTLVPILSSIAVNCSILSNLETKMKSQNESKKEKKRKKYAVKCGVLNIEFFSHQLEKKSQTREHIHTHTHWKWKRDKKNLWQNLHKCSFHSSTGYMPNFFAYNYDLYP